MNDIQLKFWKWWDLRNKISRYGDCYDWHNEAADLEDEITEARA